MFNDFSWEVCEVQLYIIYLLATVMMIIYCLPSNFETINYSKLYKRFKQIFPYYLFLALYSYSIDIHNPNKYVNIS